MSEPETTLARITKATLGYEDHGMLTSYLHLEYAEVEEKMGGSGQGFGGYSLRGEYTDRWVRGVLDAVGVRDWLDLKGRLVWANHTWDKVHYIVGVETGVSFTPNQIMVEP